ncbi:MAG: NADH-quinone oxidoreductase subunit NuoG [Chloroflexi bacterium]|nr:NADH-quinone oxidoreductase subunit NuoG [Chloroflexota bacterium]
MAKEVTLTIDGQQVTVPAGTIVVDAAKKIGIDIPVFCYHPKMEPVGMCRMCLVEIGRPVHDRATGEQQFEEDGSAKLQFSDSLETACTVPVSEGMVVRGMTEKVQKGRKDILEFLLTSHPLDCPVCDKGGECPLQNITLEYGSSESRFDYDNKIHFDKNVPLGDLIYLDRERCIQCARCIRFQRDIVDDPVIEFYHRGRSTDIVTISEPGFDSYWSGNTTDICPVGALTTSDFRFGARSWELNHSASICSHCAVGCNLTYNTRREAKSGGDFVIKRVMPRQNEQVNELWICDKGRFSHHFTHSTDRLTQPLIRKDGELVPASWEEALSLVAENFKQAGEDLITLVSGRLPNEDLFNLNKLTTGVGGTASLYTHMAGGDLVAQAGMTKDNNLSTISADDAILVIGSDLEEEAPIWWLRVKQAAEKGTTLIVANPRPTKTDANADFIIRYPYGKEVATVENLASGDDNAAKAFAKAKNTLVFFDSEGTNLATSSALAQACANLLGKTGHKSGLVGVWPRANTQGAWDIGLRPGADLDTAKALYIVAADPVGDDPELSQTINAADFVVVQELFLTETAKLANVVLPAQAQTEREGSFTSGERRVQRFYMAVKPNAQCRADFDIAAQLGAKLGVDLKGRFPSLVMSMINAEISGYSDASYEEMAKVVDQWPIISREDLFYGGTSYENKQGLGIQLELQSTRETRKISGYTNGLPEGDLIAVPINLLYDHGTMLSKSDVLQSRTPEPFVSLNPKDAQRIKASDGMTISITLGPESYIVVVKLDKTVPAGVVLVPRSIGIPIHGPAAIKIHIAETALA